MKTEEDEAFDELAKRQGDWGGGFKAKQAMAADKLKEYDPCPQCIKGAVCRTPKCGRLALPLDHPFRNAQPAQEPKDIAKLIEGMEVSVDVSTGEHDSGNRLFGTVTLAQENQSSKHGLILLVQEPEPNFKTTAPPQREWVGLTDDEVNYCIKFPNRNLFARDGTTSQRIARAIEAKLKEKNNGA